MLINEIVKNYLNEKGYDGLYRPGTCACKIDDLMSCDNFEMDCEAGYLLTGENVHCDNCEGSPCDFHIGAQ